jgi:hypothetical protein
MVNDLGTENTSAPFAPGKNEILEKAHAEKGENV